VVSPPKTPPPFFTRQGKTPPLFWWKKKKKKIKRKFFKRKKKHPKQGLCPPDGPTRPRRKFGGVCEPRLPGCGGKEGEGVKKVKDPEKKIFG